MQLDALRVFCDVARLRSISQAAVARKLTQSAVSHIVLTLEGHLKVQLVDRSTRPLQLTPQGKAYYEGCRQLLEQYDELEASVRNAQAQLDVTVQVAAIYSVGLGDMGQHVERFTREHAGARVHVEYLHPDRVYERVMEGAADLGLVSFPRTSRDLEAVPWREEPMVLACSPEHPLAKQPNVRPDQLEGEKFVAFDRDLVIRRQLNRFFKQQNVNVNVVMEFDNIESIKKAVELKAGASLLPGPTVRREVEAGTLVAIPLAGCRLVRPLGIIRSRHHKLHTGAALFIESLRHGLPGDTDGVPALNGRSDTVGSHTSSRSRRPRLARGFQGKA
jgi:DNA-binding transcriptional LysR family regulator